MGDTGAAVVELDRPGVLRPARGGDLAFAGGGLPSGLASSYITVNYYTPNDLSTPVMYCSAGTCSPNSICGPSANGPCTNGSMNVTLSNGKVVNYVNQPGNVVEVAAVGRRQMHHSGNYIVRTGSQVANGQCRSSRRHGRAAGHNRRKAQSAERFAFKNATAQKTD
jgi:hypothetical protein